MKLIQVISDNCTGCRICEMVCSFRHEQECSTTKSRIRILKDKEFGNHLLQLCIQCADAPCIESCPREALYRDEKTGVVIVDEENCTGCEECIEACPLHALFLDKEKDIIFKCDLCGGEAECVKVCPVQTLVLKEEDISSPARESFMEETSKLLSSRLGGK